MIQLSALAATGPDNTLKTATFAGVTGVFESLLAGEAEGAADKSGKVLPEGGKVLPDPLPVALIFTLASRKPAAQLTKTPEETPENEAAPDGDDEPADMGAETQLDDAETIATVAELALIPQLAVPTGAEQIAAKDAIDAEGESASRQPFRHLASHPVPAEVRQAIRDAAALKAESAPQTDAPPRGVTTTPAALAAMTAAMRGPVTGEAAKSALEGEKPADAPQPSRIAPASRPEPIRAIRFELSSNTRGESGADRSAPRTPSLSPLMVEAAGPSIAEPVTAAASAPAGKSEGAAPMTPQVQVPRPHDLDTLVNRLVEARDNARAGNASVTVMHEDFGKVSLRFSHENGSLSVTMANNDPGFARAVNAAVAPDQSMGGEAQPQGERRGEGGQGSASRTGTSEQGGTGEGGNNSRGGRAARGETQANRHRPEAEEARKAMGGVFA